MVMRYMSSLTFFSVNVSLAPVHLTCSVVHNVANSSECECLVVSSVRTCREGFLCAEPSLSNISPKWLLFNKHLAKHI